MSIDYSQFYRETTRITPYGNGAYKKDTLVKYEFNTVDKYGNKVMDKMSKEETLQMMRDIRSQYGEEVIVEFSGDGMAALVESRKGIQANTTQEAIEKKNAAFQKEIKYYDKSINDFPIYSGIYDADKVIASALENCKKEEREFVYHTIQYNFLIENSNSMTEEERKANISLGMKKAEYAAEHFISADNRKSFLEAMETIAKLATAGEVDNYGNIDYRVAKGSYLGHGSSLTYTTNAVDMMQRMDGKAYEEYQKLKQNKDGELNSLKYLTNWYQGVVIKNPSIIDNYERQSEEYVEKHVKNQKLE